ncbi:transposase [Escherichia coli]|nr:transposase [Escherichia coli]
MAQNAFIESFNRTYRTKILGFCLFRTLDEKRELAANWLSEYNSVLAPLFPDRGCILS